MRSFRERLARIQPSEISSPPAIRSDMPIEAIESGYEVANQHGTVYVVERRWDNVSCSHLTAGSDLSSSFYFSDLTQQHLRNDDILFLDTETTGLAGGTGTHVFLVGLGYFDGPVFITKQYFLRDLHEEEALLAALNELLQRFRVLVTFNGKTFDWPLLVARFTLHGYRSLPSLPHLDLLHPARRLWKHRLPNCSLGTLEQAIFGIRRYEDVPGFLIPQLYFDYLRDRNASRLRPVFAHNRRDVATMAQLVDLFVRAEHAPRTAFPHADDHVYQGIYFISRGRFAHGVNALVAALGDNSVSRATRVRGESALAMALKRAGRTPEAVEIWQLMCERASRVKPFDPGPFVELAKYLEHTSRDYGSAIEIVERALTLQQLHDDFSGRDELLHRLGRLQRKRARAIRVR